MMLIGTEAALALYCPHCGKLHMHLFSRFAMNRSVCRVLTCSCGQVQATITRVIRRQFFLDIPCVICGTSHKISINAQQFWKADMERLYLTDENVEIGFFGSRHTIEENMARQIHEFEKVVGEKDCDDGQIDNPQIMFEVFNHVHDLVVRGGVVCHCGMPVFDAEVLSGCISLSCGRCGSQLVIPASSETDLEKIKLLSNITLTPRRRMNRNH